MPGQAQTDLDACYAAAEAYAPVARRYGLAEQAKAYSLENAARGWWPQLQFEASAQVQSDVTKLPIDISRLGLTGIDIPKMDKDRYAATLSLQQALYDGGRIRSKKALAQADAEVAQHETAAALYALHEQVNQLYFGLLLTHEQLRLNELLQHSLNLNLAQAHSLERAGLEHEADLAVVRVELLQAEQTAVTYRATAKAYAGMLARLTGLPLEKVSKPIRPALPAVSIASAGSPVVHRPEAALYEARLRRIDTARNQLSASWRPNLSFFAQGGYGRPGLNMLKDDFTFYGLAGIRLTWNISQLYTRKSDMALLNNQADQIRTSQSDFNYRTGVEEADRMADLSRYTDLLAHDDEIITLREQIRKASEARFASGTMTATDLMVDINSEQQARLDRVLHEMQQLLSAYNLRYTRGE